MNRIDIEFICTGNQCRSPMAESFTRRIVTERGLDAKVSSSGLLPAGSPPPDEVVELMAARGIDVSDHRSRPFDADIVAGADLILGMERRHVTEIIAIDPEAYRRTFTLVEFVRRLGALELAGDTAPELSDVLSRIGATRGRRDVLRISVDEEIVDPMGRPMKIFGRVADEIEGLLGQMTSMLWPSGDPAATGPTPAVS